MADQQDSNDQKAENQAPASEPPKVEQGAAPAPTQEAPQAEQPVPSATPGAPAPVAEQPAAAEPTPAPAENTPIAEEEKAAPAVPEFMKKDKQQPPTQPEERMWALLAYIPLVSLVSLVMKPDSKFVKLHGQQGLLLVGIFFVAIFFYIIPYVGPVIMLLLHLMLMAIGLFSMYQAYIGNWWKIPVLGDVATAIPVDALTKVTRTAVMSEKVDQEKREEAAQAPVESKESEKTPEQQPSSEQQPPATPQGSPEGEAPQEQAPKESGESNDQPSG